MEQLCKGFKAPRFFSQRHRIFFISVMNVLPKHSLALHSPCQHTQTFSSRCVAPRFGIRHLTPCSVFLPVPLYCPVCSQSGGVAYAFISRQDKLSPIRPGDARRMLKGKSRVCVCVCVEFQCTEKGEKMQ